MTGTQTTGQGAVLLSGQDGDLATQAFETAKQVFQVEAQALAETLAAQSHAFAHAVSLLATCDGKIVVTGMGKSGIIAQKLAATLSSTGTPAVFLHPAEGLHGDLGVMAAGDIVIALSKSGETTELLQVLPVIRHLALPLIAITANPQSTLAQRSQLHLPIVIASEACPNNLAPTASTTATLVLGDALAMAVSRQKGFTADDFARIHPAGSLGKRLLLTVAEVMHSNESLPVVDLKTTFQNALIEMTSKKLGLAVVVDDEGKTCGILTDGDVRRVFATSAEALDGVHWTQLPVSQLCGKSPKIIAANALAAEALNIMETHLITALIINDAEGRPIGVVHLHDLLKTGI